MIGATDDHQVFREGVRAICADFPDQYCRQLAEHDAYPEEFDG